jgi:hypothetical protein
LVAYTLIAGWSYLSRLLTKVIEILQLKYGFGCIFYFYSKAKLFLAKVKLDTISIISDLDFRKSYEMYISLAESRTKGFVRWADAHERQKVSEARAGAGADRDTAAPDLDQGRTMPPQPLDRS